MPNKVNLETCSLEEMEMECIEVQGTPYGHNIIGIICRAAKDRFGKEAADRLFEKYQK